MAKYWSDKDTRYLLKNYSKGMPVAQIAQHLGFHQSQVYGRAKYLNLPRMERTRPNKTKWTKREITFIKKNFHKLTNPQIAKALGKTLTLVRTKCYEMGLRHMEMEYWTEEQVQYLKSNYRTKGDAQLAAEFEDRWPKKKQWTKKHIEKKRKYLGINRTLEEQFLIRTGRFNAKDYNNFNGKNFPQGKKRLWFQNGKYRWMIKVGKVFFHYHRYKWEKLRGPIPEGYKLHFKDGDTTNCRINNLELLTRSDLARKISNKNHKALTDSYIAGLLSWRDPEMKKHVMNHPGIIAAKREQIITNRKMGLHRCKKGSPAISQL